MLGLLVRDLVYLTFVNLIKVPKANFSFQTYALKTRYHMYGSRIGSLSVYATTLLANSTVVQTKPAIWTDSRNHGDYWKFAQIQYPGGNQSIQNFIIEAYASSSSAGI